MLLPALSPVGTGALGEKVMNDGEPLTCGALLGLFLPPELGGLIIPLPLRALVSSTKSSGFPRSAGNFFFLFINLIIDFFFFFPR